MVRRSISSAVSPGPRVPIPPPRRERDPSHPPPYSAWFDPPAVPIQLEVSVGFKLKGKNIKISWLRSNTRIPIEPNSVFELRKLLSITTKSALCSSLICLISSFYHFREEWLE